MQLRACYRIAPATTEMGVSAKDLRSAMSSSSEAGERPQVWSIIQSMMARKSATPVYLSTQDAGGITLMSRTGADKLH